MFFNGALTLAKLQASQNQQNMSLPCHLGPVQILPKSVPGEDRLAKAAGKPKHRQNMSRPGRLGLVKVVQTITKIMPGEATFAKLQANQNIDRTWPSLVTWDL